MKMMTEVLQQMKPVLYNLMGLCAIAVERNDTKVHNVLRRIQGLRINGQSEKQSNICKQKLITEICPSQRVGHFKAPC